MNAEQALREAAENLIAQYRALHRLTPGLLEDLERAALDAPPADPPATYSIRIRTPDDPDGWTALAENQPVGMPYTYSTIGVAVWLTFQRHTADPYGPEFEERLARAIHADPAAGCPPEDECLSPSRHLAFAARIAAELREAAR
jgi:hypothetical protein